MSDSRRFQKVGVLMGGPSAEREVSLRSGAAVAQALRARGYEVLEIVVNSHAVEVPSGVEAVFVALHGEFGEDGGIQSILKERGIPYTGAGPEASLNCFDKIRTKRILEDAGIPTPAYQILRRGENVTMPLPLVVKPARQGSSIGVHLVFHAGELEPAVEDAFRYDHELIVEEFIAGAELTVGIVGGMALPVIEIRAPQGFYNYEAKYTKGWTEYLVPAPISDAATEACQTLALRTFKALGCRDLGRVDFRMDAQERLYVLELNNIPGFTETSLLPKAARVVGIDFPELCDRILSMAVVH